jgi:hypothetical protein
MGYRGLPDEHTSRFECRKIPLSNLPENCSTFVQDLFKSDQGCFNTKVGAITHYTTLPQPIKTTYLLVFSKHQNHPPPPCPLEHP